MRQLLFVLLLAITIDVLKSEECRCAAPYGHPQDMFCTADYVIRGMVVSGPQERILNITRALGASSHWHRRTLAYKIQLRAVYRGTSVIKATLSAQRGNYTLVIPSEVTIYTDHNACAARLQLGIEYLIAGYSDRERLEVYLCNWLVPWGDLPSSQQIAIKRYYGRHCACRTSLCSVLDPLGRIMDFECGAKNLYCALRRDGVTCRWRSVGRWYRKCLESIKAWQ